MKVSGSMIKFMVRGFLTMLMAAVTKDFGKMDIK